jgi:PAS domain S-box-containing protein
MVDTPHNPPFQSNQEQQAQAQLEKERRFVEAIFAAVDTLIVILDRNGRVTRMNRACEALTGYVNEDVQGQLFWSFFFQAEEAAQVRADFADFTASQSPHEGENYWQTKDGRQRLISWSFAERVGFDGAVEYVIITGTDVTRKKKTALLQNARDNLQQVTTALLQHLTTLDDVLAIVCQAALELTGAGGSAVLLLEDEKWLRVKNSSGLPRPALERLPIGKSFAGLVMGQGKPLLLNDPQREIQAYHRNPDLQTLLAVPLYVDDTVMGALDVVNKPGGFTDEDIQVMQLFADQAAIAIEHAQLHQQAERLAVIEERQRLARELHDSVTQALYSVTLYADATRMALSAGKEDVAATHLQDLRMMAREAMIDMRLLIFELRPPVLEKEGLVTAVQTRLEAVEARSGLRTTLHVEGQEVHLPLSIEEELYRVVQEALNNAVRHARAQQVTIEFLYEDELFSLIVRDDGRGFDPAIARQSGGLGLRGIEERVERIGGKLIVESALEEGTALQVQVKL